MRALDALLLALVLFATGRSALAQEAWPAPTRGLDTAPGVVSGGWSTSRVASVAGLHIKITIEAACLIDQLATLPASNHGFDRTFVEGNAIVRISCTGNVPYALLLDRGDSVIGTGPELSPVARASTQLTIAY
jgi:spore coat protein U-like protein